MRIVTALTALALLAACGADGEPIPPSRNDVRPADGIRISGEARIGVVKKF